MLPAFASAGSKATPAPPGCSPKIPSARPSHWRRLDTELAPHGARAIRLCQYLGLNGTPRKRLIAEALVSSPRTVSKLIGDLDALPKAIGGTVACGTDDGAEIVAYVRYATNGVVPIVIASNGCLAATNGHYTASDIGPNARKLNRLMARLLRPLR